MADAALNQDWVTARSQCSAGKMFTLLREIADQNRRTRNDMEQDRGHFELINTVDGFCILDSWHTGHPRRVRFTLEKEAIQVTFTADGKDRQQRATVTLTDDLRCVFRVGEGEVEPWQLAKRALEPLFFGQ